MEAQTIVTFTVAALVLLLIPGPAVLYIVARAVDQGRTAGVVSALGISAGTLVHAIGASVGISALLLSSALAFATLKYLGAAYLIYLGVRTLLSKDSPSVITRREPATLRRIFSQGVAVNVLNPKVALFFFAFLPQFVDPVRGSVALQTLLLGCLFAAMGAVTDSGYALVSGSIGSRLRGTARFRRARRYVAGGMYLALGATAALVGSDKK